MDQELKRKLDLLVGSALTGVLEAGADHAYVGAFAMRHCALVSQMFGPEAEVSTAPSLEAAIKSALKEVLAAEGPHFVESKSRKPNRTRVFVTVGGRRTAVTLAPDILEGLVSRVGSRKAATAYIQEQAERSKSNPTDNRSRWVEAQIVQLLNSPSPQLDETTRH